MKMKYLLALLLLLMSGMTYADCTYNGKPYAEGSVIGPIKCVSGEWVKR